MQAVSISKWKNSEAVCKCMPRYEQRVNAWGRAFIFPVGSWPDSNIAFVIKASVVVVKPLVKTRSKGSERRLQTWNEKRQTQYAWDFYQANISSHKNSWNLFSLLDHCVFNITVLLQGKVMVTIYILNTFTKCDLFERHLQISTFPTSSGHRYSFVWYIVERKPSRSSVIH